MARAAVQASQMPTTPLGSVAQPAHCHVCAAAQHRAWSWLVARIAKRRLLERKRQLRGPPHWAGAKHAGHDPQESGRLYVKGPER